ncbi:glycosyltransferase [Mucilaginibacter gilvus]|uniref:Glycosyltransferase family 2 protein n=1 Tax=Mucilaginibacter gilvus TaxID=2305909 RepID=A0A444MJ54_9SPHI|nr:glycosyltransferase [Mucilaginibacter gilvus]RWY48110.1 glycosyltransferase family 2 protein [Mucilaginibacter gilvus]
MNGISVIICCYNSTSLLAPTLAHLAKQKTDASLNWEIIVVDNASTDNTSTFAAEEWRKYQSPADFKIVFESSPGLMSARIKGKNESKYDYLIFCDDDNWLCEGYVQNAFRVMDQNKNIGLCGGAGSPVYEIDKPEWLSNFIAETGYAMGPQGSSSEGPVDSDRPLIYGAGTVARKKLLQDIYANFNHSNLLLSGRKGTVLAAGDDAAISFFALMNNHQLWYSSKLQFKHFIPKKRLNKEYALRMYEGFGAASAHIKLYHSFLPGTGPVKKLFYAHWIGQLILQTILVVKDYFLFKEKSAKPFIIKMQTAALKEIVKNHKELNDKRAFLSKYYL